MSPKLKNKKINNIILNKNNSIFDAVRKLNKSDFQVCLVLDEKLKLLGKKVDIDLINTTCTNIPFTYLNNYTQLCKDRSNLVEAIKLFYMLYENGYSVMDILDNYFCILRLLILLMRNKNI